MIDPSSAPERLSAPPSRTALGSAAAAAFIVFLGLIHLYPLSLHPARLHPDPSSDTQEMMWRLGWGLHSLATDPRHFLDADNFYPDEGTYATMDYAYGLIPLSAPLRAVTANPLAIYNGTALATIAISAWGAYLLGKRLTGRRGAALVAAAVFAFNPLHLGRIGQLNILAIHWLPWLVLVADRLFERPTVGRASAMAATLFLAITSGGHQAVFAAGVLGWSVLVMAWARPETRWRGLALSVAAIAVAGALFYPLARPYLASASDRSRMRTLHDVRRQSPEPSDLLVLDSVAHRRLRAFVDPGGSLTAHTKSTLFPGILALGLAVMGAVHASSRPGRRTWVVLLGGLAVAGFTLSLGIHAPGYAFLFEHLAPLHMIRAPSRFTLVGLLGLAGLAAFATEWLGERGRAVHRWGAGAVACVIALLHWGETFDRVGIDSYHYDPPPPVYRWLAAQPDSFAVVELPTTWESNAFYLVYSTYHWKDLVNGFNASYIDLFHNRLLFEVLPKFPNDASRDALFQILGLRYLILHTSPDGEQFRLRGHYHARQALADALASPPAWLRPVWSEGGSTVAELVEPEQGFTAPLIQRVAPSRVLRGKKLVFEVRGSGEEGGTVVTLNRSKLTSIPLTADFARHEVDIPEAALHSGINVLQWRPGASTSAIPSTSASATVTVRGVGLEPPALQ